MRKINAKVKAGAKQNSMEWKDKDTCHIWVTAPPQNGKANDAVLELLSNELNLSKSSILILKGETSSRKIIGILS